MRGPRKWFGVARGTLARSLAALQRCVLGQERARVARTQNHAPFVVLPPTDGAPVEGGAVAG
jgi:hypothetical protein